MDAADKAKEQAEKKLEEVNTKIINLENEKRNLQDKLNQLQPAYNEAVVHWVELELKAKEINFDKEPTKQEVKNKVTQLFDEIIIELKKEKEEIKIEVSNVGIRYGKINVDYKISKDDFNLTGSLIGSYKSDSTRIEDKFLEDLKQTKRETEERAKLLADYFKFKKTVMEDAIKKGMVFEIDDETKLLSVLIQEIGLNYMKNIEMTLSKIDIIKRSSDTGYDRTKYDYFHSEFNQGSRSKDSINKEEKNNFFR